MGRWVLTIAIPALITVFVILLLMDKWGERHLVILPLSSTDQLTLPGKPFAQEDLEGIREIADFDSHHVPESAQDEAALDQYLSTVGKIPQGKRDVLVLYVSGHGFADSGRAYLACTDFDRGTTSGRYEIGRLLQSISSSPGLLKLLILDAGGIDYDPRLGIVGNEFPALVSSAVEQLAKQEMWVLLSCGGSQTTAVSYADQRSVFAKAVRDALSGEANIAPSGNGDSYVDLQELHTYVARTCQNWFGPKKPHYQTPILLKAGEGTRFDPASLDGSDYRLLYLTAKKTEEEKQPPESTPEKKVDIQPTATAQRVTLPAEPDRKWANESVASLTQFPRALPLAVAQASAAKPQEKTEGDKGEEAKAKSEPTGPSEAPPPKKDVAVEESETKSAEKSPDGSSPSEPPPAKSVEAVPPDSAEKSVPTTPKGSSEKKAGAKPAPAKPDPAELTRGELLTALGRLWEVRDKLHRREAKGLSPIDFAPHLWRETEAWILHYEARVRAAGAILRPTSRSDSEKLLSDMRGLAANLEALLAAISNGDMARAEDDQSVGDRLADAWNRRYLVERKSDDERFEREESSRMIELRQAVRGLSDRLYRAVDYVRWFGYSNSTLTGFEQYHGAISTHLDELAKLLALHNDLARSRLTAGDQARVSQLMDDERTLAASEQRILEMVQEFEADSISRPQDHLAQRRMEELLSTPILTSSRRMNLVDALGTLRRAPVEKIAEPESTGPSPVPPRPQFDWARVRACLELERKLIALVDTDTAGSIERFVREADTEAKRATTDSIPADFFERYRGALKLLKSFYNGLPRTMNDEFVLHLIDPRDAISVDEPKYPLPRLRIELEQPDELRLEPLAQVVRLGDNLEGRVGLTLIATRAALLNTRVVPSSDHLQISELPQEGSELPVERGLYRRTIHWQLTAKRGVINEGKNATQVRFVARLGDTEANTSVEIILPQPNRVDAFFARLGVPADAGGQSDELMLELFANRNTKFICTLANQHDEPKTVEVLFYAIAPRPFARAPIGKLDDAIRNSVYDRESKVFLDAKLVAKSAPIQLPGKPLTRPTAARVPVEFASASPPPAPPPANGEKAEAKPPAPPKVEPEPIHALALKIVDVNRRTDEWVKWIELAPLAPREYLHADIGYDQRQQQIVASFRPKEGRLPAGKPIEFVWDIAGANLPEQGMRQEKGQLDATSDQPVLTLRAAVPVDDKPHEIKISADGYPRAFYYRVVCRKDDAGPEILPGDDLARERTAIRIESVSVDQQPVVYHFPPHRAQPAAEQKPESKEPKIEHRNVTFRQPALFAGPADALTVKLEADAPIDAFTSDNDRVRVKLGELSRVLQTTRDLKAFFLEAGAGGVIELSTRVSDLAIPLNVGNLQNDSVVVNAEIKFGTREDISQIEVQFDGHAPVIRTLDVKGPVVKGAIATAKFRVDELFGIDRVAFGFSKDGSKNLPDAAASRPVSAQRAGPGQFAFSLDINTQEMATGKHLLLAKVFDHVGKESAVASVEFRIVEPKPGPTTGEIRGVIKAGRSNVNGILFDLTIEGDEFGSKAVPVQPNGTFVVRDLPPGEYTFKPTGSVGGRTVKEKEFKVKLVDIKKGADAELNVAD